MRWLRQTLEEFDRENVVPAWEERKIWVASDQAFLPAYEFAGWDTCYAFHQHAMLGISVNRILQRASEINGRPKSEVEERPQGWSERIWRTLPYVERMSKGARGARVSFLAPLVLSIDDPEMGCYLGQKGVEISGPRARFLGDSPGEEFLSVCNILTGQSDPS